MSVFANADFDRHQKITHFHDVSGLRAIIAVHDTSRGPALGGCRMYPYASESQALADVLRLSRGMSYKAAVADVALGGGKSVIIGDPSRDKSETLLRAMGRAIDSLGGSYITGEDIGTNPADMNVMRQETRFVSCLAEQHGGYGDPAPLTALGVFQAMSAGLQSTRGDRSFRGLRVAVQGVGNVGLNLCQLLAEAGAELIACDPNEENVRRARVWGARIVPLAAIYRVDADIFAPCAIGGTLNDQTIPQLAVRIVAGAANNQLAEPRHAEALRNRGITYLPDYVANGGGLISCAAEWYRTELEAVRPRVLRIYNTCLETLALAEAADISTQAAADRLAREKLHPADLGPCS